MAFTKSSPTNKVNQITPTPKPMATPLTYSASAPANFLLDSASGRMTKVDPALYQQMKMRAPAEPPAPAPRQPLIVPIAKAITSPQGPVNALLEAGIKKIPGVVPAAQTVAKGIMLGGAAAYDTAKNIGKALFTTDSQSNYNTTKKLAESYFPAAQAAPTQKTFYRKGVDIYDASTNQRIGPADWMNNWSGRSVEVAAPSAPTTPSAPTAPTQPPASTAKVESLGLRSYNPDGTVTEYMIKDGKVVRDVNGKAIPISTKDNLIPSATAGGASRADTSSGAKSAPGSTQGGGGATLLPETDLRSSGGKSTSETSIKSGVPETQIGGPLTVEGVNAMIDKARSASDIPSYDSVLSAEEARRKEMAAIINASYDRQRTQTEGTNRISRQSAEALGVNLSGGGANISSTQVAAVQDVIEKGRIALSELEDKRIEALSKNDIDVARRIEDRQAKIYDQTQKLEENLLRRIDAARQSALAAETQRHNLAQESLTQKELDAQRAAQVKFVTGDKYQKAGVFNPYTGTFTPLADAQRDVVEGTGVDPSDIVAWKAAYMSAADKKEFMDNLSGEEGLAIKRALMLDPMVAATEHTTMKPGTQEIISAMTNAFTADPTISRETMESVLRRNYGIDPKAENSNGELINPEIVSVLDGMYKKPGVFQWIKSVFGW